MKNDEYGTLYNGKKVVIMMNPKYPYIDVYGDAGHDCGSFTNEGLKELVDWLKENKSELFK